MESEFQNTYGYVEDYEYMSSKVRSISKDKGVVKNLTDLHNKYVVVPTDKASNIIVFVCKTYYIDCLVK